MYNITVNNLNSFAVSLGRKLTSLFIFRISKWFREFFLSESNISPLEQIQEKCFQELNTLFKIFVILYVDDTVVLAESEEGMQNALNIFQLYCKQWKLEVNVNKSKIIIFSKRKSRSNFEFKLQHETIEVVDSFSYLGIFFKYNGCFSESRKKLVNQAHTSLFSIYKSIRNQNIPIDLQLKIFDAMVERILLYGSEIWGYENIKIIEQVHLGFCKRILKVRSSTPNFMVHVELGRYPLEIRVKIRMISFWNRLVNNNERMSSCIYRLLYSLKSNGIQSFKWLNCIESIFNDVGLSYIFENQIGFINVKYITQILHEQFIQKWFSDIENSSRGEFYSLFKKNFGLENYLLKLPVQNRIWMTKLRTCNLRIPIETGRWTNIPRQERTWTFCNDNVGNEFHVFFYVQ